jgi:hypothetical protein
MSCGMTEDEMKLCQGRDICKHEKCYHYLPHKETKMCSVLICRRPDSESKTKSKCVDIKSEPIFTSARRLRPCEN